MQIKSLELNNFRNYESLSINFDEGTNIIYGENAQGKTNILEAIYMCCLGKSHRHNKENEIIRFSNKEAHIKSEFIRDTFPLRIDIHLKKNGKKGVAINRIPIKRVSELYGNVSVVIFSPEDLDIIKRGPSVRRDFIDQEVCQIDPIYVSDLINYSRILHQRHELFKTMDVQPERKEELTETLDIWDLQLVNFGTKIIKRRKSFIEELNNIIFDIHHEITDGREELKLVYEPSVLAEEFYEELLKNREKDRIYKSTSVGPHRDDFSFYEKDKNLKIYGSQGQQRTCVISLKLAEIKMIDSVKKETPILLLDDVLSELDRIRQQKLLKSIGQTQTIITCTGVDEFVENEIGTAKKFYIKDAELISNK
ncbi:MAG: DNA replication/repair protein RecF [Lachnospiraceae bacterium]|nr:DNA replication/repair protein RecF [Lachnospiraceae bacterium]